MSFLLKSNLPIIENVVHFNNDSSLIIFIQSILKLAQLADKPYDDLSYSLSWVIKLIINKSQSKNKCFYSIGMIHLGNFVAFNLNILSGLLGMSMVELQIKISTWKTIIWEPFDKNAVLSEYDKNYIPQHWQLMRLNPSDPIVLAFLTHTRLETPRVKRVITPKNPNKQSNARSADTNNNSENTSRVNASFVRNIINQNPPPNSNSQISIPPLLTPDNPSLQPPEPKKNSKKTKSQCCFAFGLLPLSISPEMWEIDTTPLERYEF